MTTSTIKEDPYAPHSGPNSQWQGVGSHTVEKPPVDPIQIPVSKLPRRKIRLVKTKFSWSVWRWTNGDESLFDLDPFQLELFNDIIREASAP